MQFCHERPCEEYPLFLIHATTLLNRRRLQNATTNTYLRSKDNDPYESTDYGTSDVDINDDDIDIETKMLIDKVHDIFLAPGAPMELNLDAVLLSRTRKLWPLQRNTPQDLRPDWDPSDSFNLFVDDKQWRDRWRLVTCDILRQVRDDLFLTVWPEFNHWRRQSILKDCKSGINRASTHETFKFNNHQQH